MGIKPRVLDCRRWRTGMVRGGGPGRHERRDKPGDEQRYNDAVDRTSLPIANPQFQNLWKIHTSFLFLTFTLANKASSTRAKRWGRSIPVMLVHSFLLVIGVLVYWLLAYWLIGMLADGCADGCLLIGVLADWRTGWLLSPWSPRWLTLF